MAAALHPNTHAACAPRVERRPNVYAHHAPDTLHDMVSRLTGRYTGCPVGAGTTLQLSLASAPAHLA